RLCDDPSTEGIQYNSKGHKEERESRGFQENPFKGIHRGKMILIVQGTRFAVEKMCGGSVINIVVPMPVLPSRTPTYARDSSPFVYFVCGRRLFAVDLDKCLFLQPVRFPEPMMTYSLAGVHEGVVSVAASHKVRWCFIRARLPEDYHERYANDESLTRTEV
ncbi:hypothetical protein PMAYCL1PPCAC_19331, partial [Pristionchus mayeri]